MILGLAGTELSEVLGRLGDDICKELELYSAQGLTCCNCLSKILLRNTLIVLQPPSWHSIILLQAREYASRDSNAFLEDCKNMSYLRV